MQFSFQSSGARGWPGKLQRSHGPPLETWPVYLCHHRPCQLSALEPPLPPPFPPPSSPPIVHARIPDVNKLSKPSPCGLSRVYEVACRSAEGKRGVDATHHFEMYALDGADGRLLWKQEASLPHPHRIVVYPRPNNTSQTIYDRIQPDMDIRT